MLDLTKENIELCLNKNDIFWEYGRNDEHYTHYVLSEWFGIWFSNNYLNDIWITYINANNYNENNVPFKINNMAEFQQLLNFINI